MKPHLSARQRSLLLQALVVPILLVAAAAQARDSADEVGKSFSWVTSETPGCACAPTSPVVPRW